MEIITLIVSLIVLVLVIVLLFKNKGKRTVLINRHNDGDDKTCLILRFCVELFRKSRDIDTVRSEH